MIEELYCPRKDYKEERQKYLVSHFDIFSADYTLLEFLKNWLGMFYQTADELKTLTPEERKELLAMYDLISEIIEEYDTESINKVKQKLNEFFDKLVDILSSMKI